MPSVRRLAAILAADVVGYSRLTGADEEGTHERLKALRHELLDPKIAEHHGRIVKTTGDGLLVEFASVVDAVRCAVEVQQAMPERNTGIGADNRIELRIGINLGDVIVEGDDLYGDGVNIAARIEALADASGVFISNTVHDHVRDRLPFGFEDLGEQQVKNIARPVRVYRVRDADSAASSPSAPAQPVLPLPDKPSIAVLPFANMSGDPEQEYFADGMVEEIITALSRIRWLFVIARNSSFAYKGQAIDVKQVGRELGVRYVLEGSVRKAVDRVRITAQLIDTATGTHIWADRFDGSLEDVFDLQDKVATSVAGVIAPALRAAEIQRSSQRPTQDLTAYDLYLRALPESDSYERDRIRRALDLLGQAIERDPRYGPALALSALCHHRLQDAGDSETHRGPAVDLARRALQAAPEDPEVLAVAAFVLGVRGDDTDVAVSLVDRALVLSPSFALGWHWSGILRVVAGYPDLALEHFETFLRLSPRERPSAHLTGLGMALFMNRRFEDAAAKLLGSLERVPNFTISLRYLAACHAHLGQLAEAREIVCRLRTITPVVLPTGPISRNPEQRELLLSGLRLAMGEAT
jgi:TolB-like protein/class 3 adenylate cyclase/Flp pilus assembly protein TadD